MPKPSLFIGHGFKDDDDIVGSQVVLAEHFHNGYAKCLTHSIA
jgi:hypothetical protein